MAMLEATDCEERIPWSLEIRPKEYYPLGQGLFYMDYVVIPGFNGKPLSYVEDEDFRNGGRDDEREGIVVTDDSHLSFYDSFRLAMEGPGPVCYNSSEGKLSLDFYPDRKSLDSADKDEDWMSVVVHLNGPSSGIKGEGIGFQLPVPKTDVSSFLDELFHECSALREDR